MRTEGLTPAQPQEAPAEKPRDAGAERRTIYVSNEGTEEDDGATAETPTTLARATELANEGKKPVEIVVLGQVSVDTWTSPTVETTLRAGTRTRSCCLSIVRPRMERTTSVWQMP